MTFVGYAITIKVIVISSCDPDNHELISSYRWWKWWHRIGKSTSREHAICYCCTIEFSYRNTRSNKVRNFDINTRWNRSSCSNPNGWCVYSLGLSRRSCYNWSCRWSYYGDSNRGIGGFFSHKSTICICTSLILDIVCISNLTITTR